MPGGQGQEDKALRSGAKGQEGLQGCTQPNERAANLKVNDRHHTTPEGTHTTCLRWEEAKTKSSLEHFFRKNVFLVGGWWLLQSWGLSY